MSTKTTIKRIALVAVSALGFGLVSAVSPANAVEATTGFSLSKSSITVVGANTGAAVFRIQLNNVSSATTATAQKLQSDETLTVSVVAVPAGKNNDKTVATNGALNADLTLTEGYVATAGNPYSSFTSSGAGASDTTATDGTFGPGQTSYNDKAASGAVARSYYLKVSKGSNDPFDQGTYTLRFRLMKGSLLVQDSTAKVTFVSSAADSGAVLTLSHSGTFYKNVPFTTYSDANYIKATIADANGGQIVTSSGAAPDLTGDVISSAGAVVAGGTFLLLDDGSTSDYGYAAATSSADPVNLGINGTYGATWTPLLASTTNKLRVRYGAASVSSTVAVYDVQSGNSSNSIYSYSGTGVVKVDSNDYTAPLTTGTVKLSVILKDVSSNILQDAPVTFVTTWSGVAAGDQTPLDGSDGITVVKTDSNGVASLTITNATPTDADYASVAITNGGTSLETAMKITWSKSKSSTATTSSEPNANFTAKLKSTNTVTFTFTDSFGSPVVGETINLALSGANNAAGATVIPSAKTDAKGQVSYTWTDAVAVADESDTITATSASTGATLARKVTYKATVPVIATLSGKFNRAADTSYPDVVPSTVIYSTNTGTDGNLINANMNTAKSLVGDASLVYFEYTAKDSAGLAVTGVPVTVAISTGGWILNSAGLPVSSLVIYPATGGLVDFAVTATTVGTKTITLTAGAVTSTAKVEFENAHTDGRVLSASAAGGNVTVSVKDAFGNPVGGVAVAATVTTGGLLGNGSTSDSFTTASDGSITFLVTGSGTVTLTSAEAPMKYLAGYADTTGLIAQAGAPAGVAKVVLEVSGGVASSDALDAANEATDAANAATDAANAAAEAADAATAAAQDAQAAVAALATQVASLIAGIKAQITTLTNLVIKIQKKVRA